MTELESSADSGAHDIILLNLNESWHRNECVSSHIEMNAATHVNESHDTHERRRVQYEQRCARHPLAQSTQVMAHK